MWECLCQRLARRWPSSPLEEHLLDELGEDGVAWLERSGIACVKQLDETSDYPCQENAGDCRMQLLAAEPGMRAFCGRQPPECGPLSFAAPPRRFHIDGRTLPGVLQRALGLEQPVQEDFDVMHLGERLFGQLPVSFLFAPNPDSGVLGSLVDRLVAHHRLAVLVFTRRQIPPASSRRKEVLWMALSEATPLPNGLQIDRVPLWDHFAPGADAGMDFWPRFRFVLNMENGELRHEGRVVQVEHNSPQWRLLVALLSHPGGVVSYSRLASALYPEQKNTDRDGRLKESVNLKLRKAAHELRQSIPTDPGVTIVENTSARGENEGGYRIDVAPERVRILQSGSAAAHPQGPVTPSHP